jgi:hypothetical protein
MPLTIVLSVGFDPSLLRARGLVLESAGCLVESASTVKEAADRFQDRDRLTSLIRASGSRTPIVSIAGNLGECDAFANATLEDGPNNFLAGIRDVLVKAEKTPAWAFKSGNR